MKTHTYACTHTLASVSLALAHKTAPSFRCTRPSPADVPVPTSRRAGRPMPVKGDFQRHEFAWGRRSWRVQCHHRKLVLLIDGCGKLLAVSESHGRYDAELFTGRLRPPRMRGKRRRGLGFSGLRHRARQCFLQPDVCVCVCANRSIKSMTGARHGGPASCGARGTCGGSARD